MSGFGPGRRRRLRRSLRRQGRKERQRAEDRLHRQTLAPRGAQGQASSAVRGRSGRAGAIVAIGGVVTEVSARLRAARERAGLTIADISASTKISPSVLLAIERGDFSKLPGEFYTRAFLRTYARELHLSPDTIVDQFDTDRLPAQPLPTDYPAAGRREVAQREAASPQPSLRAPWPQVMAIVSHAGVAIAVVIVVLVALVVRNRSVTTRPPEPGQSARAASRRRRPPLRPRNGVAGRGGRSWSSRSWRPPRSG